MTRRTWTCLSILVLAASTARSQEAPADDTSPSPAAPAVEAQKGLAISNVIVSGVLSVQYRQAVSDSLEQTAFPGGQDTDLRVPHAHLGLNATLGEKGEASLLYCLSHEGTTALYEAYIGYEATDALNIKLGRWILPFGAWNPIISAELHDPISAPLMYAGHEEEEEFPQSGPQPILNDQDSDVGLLVSGAREAGSATVGYAAWVSNGKADVYGSFPGAWIDYRHMSDNNGKLAPGARASVSTRGLTLGASFAGGQWDLRGSQDYRIYGADATYALSRGLTLRAEYTRNPVDRATEDGGDFTRSGWYGMATYSLSPRWSVFGMYSSLSQTPQQQVKRMSRATLGAGYRLVNGISLKAEIGRLMLTGGEDGEGPGPNDVTLLKMAAVASF